MQNNKMLEELNLQQRNELCSKFLNVEHKNQDYSKDLNQLYWVLRNFDQLSEDNKLFENSKLSEIYRKICDDIDMQITLYPTDLTNLFYTVTNGIYWYKSLSEQKINVKTFTEIFKISLPTSGQEFNINVIEVDTEQPIGLDEENNLVFAQDYGFNSFHKSNNFRHKPVIICYCLNGALTNKNDLIINQNKIEIQSILTRANKITAISCKALSETYSCRFLTVESIKYRITQIRTLYDNSQNIFDELKLLYEVPKQETPLIQWEFIASKFLNFEDNKIEIISEKEKSELQEHLHKHFVEERKTNLDKNYCIIDKPIFNKLYPLFVAQKDALVGIPTPLTFPINQPSNHICVRVELFDKLKTF